LASAGYTEADIAAEVQAFFEAEGFECWPEVHRIDIVARRGTEVIGVEVKTSFNAKLVAQALQAMSFCGAAYFATPRVADSATMYIRDAVIEKSGLGCVEVTDWGYATTAHGRFEVKRIAEPRRHRADALSCITELLVPETKAWTTPGHPSCRAVTKFRVTAIRIRDYVRDHVGCTVAEVLAEVPTHWNKRGAATNLLVSLDKGIIDGVKMVVRQGVATALVPADPVE
jgi:hypothetical protein